MKILENISVGASHPSTESLYQPGLYRQYSQSQQAESRPLIGPDPSRYCALIGWDHSVATPALLCHKDRAQGTQSTVLGAFLSFRRGIDAAVSNMIIPTIMNSLCACPPITVSLCQSRTPRELHSESRTRRQPGHRHNTTEEFTSLYTTD